MKVIPIKTSRVELDTKESIDQWITGQLFDNNQALMDGDILIVSSKILSYFEGRVVSLDKTNLQQLIEEEADEILSPSKWVTLTRKNGILCPNAGIDTSNVREGYAVLWPEDAFESARRLRESLRSLENIGKLAVLISDCVCQPGRSGTTAIAIGYSGISGFQDLKDASDLFGNTLRYSALNIVDSLATAANLLMGEGNESQPLAIIRDYRWDEVEETKNGEMNISPSDEMFPL